MRIRQIANLNLYKEHQKLKQGVYVILDLFISNNLFHAERFFSIPCKVELMVCFYSHVQVWRNGILAKGRREPSGSRKPPVDNFEARTLRFLLQICLKTSSSKE